MMDLEALNQDNGQAARVRSEVESWTPIHLLQGSMRFHLRFVPASAASISWGSCMRRNKGAGYK